MSPPMNIGRMRVWMWIGITTVFAVSCGGSRPADNTSNGICHEHFKSSTLSSDLKVQDGALVGGHLGLGQWDKRTAQYPPGDRLVRCLVPTGPDKAQVWDIEVNVDKKFLRWTQEGRGATEGWQRPT